MNKHLLIAVGLLAAVAGVTAFSSAAPAQQSRMKECADEWSKLKAANQTGGKTYRQFSKDCMSKGAAATPSTPAAEPKPAPTATTTTAPAAKPSTTAAKPSDGRQAMIARERACGAEWKADKAAGKIATGMTWPKYWSECNTRKKAQGM